MNISISRDSVTRFFAVGFFHKSSSPKPLKITLWTFRSFSKIRGDIRKSRCTTGVRYQRHWWCTLSWENLGEFLKKKKHPQGDTQGRGLAETDTRKSRGTVPLRETSQYLHVCVFYDIQCCLHASTDWFWLSRTGSYSQKTGYAVFGTLHRYNNKRHNKIYFSRFQESHTQVHAVHFNLKKNTFQHRWQLLLYSIIGHRLKTF